MKLDYTVKLSISVSPLRLDSVPKLKLEPVPRLKLNKQKPLKLDSSQLKLSI